MMWIISLLSTKDLDVLELKFTLTPEEMKHLFNTGMAGGI